MVGILAVSVLSAVVMQVLLKIAGGRKGKKSPGVGSGSDGPEERVVDGAARREVQERGLGRFWWWR